MNETNNRVTDITVCGAVVLCPCATSHPSPSPLAIFRILINRIWPSETRLLCKRKAYQRTCRYQQRTIIRKRHYLVTVTWSQL